MYFLIEDDDLLKRDSSICDKVGSDNIKREFDSVPVYNKKFFKTKRKSHGDEAPDLLIMEFLRRALIILVQQ